MVAAIDLVILTVIPALALIIAKSAFPQLASLLVINLHWAFYITFTAYVMAKSRLYSSLWRFASSSDFLRIFLSTILSLPLLVAFNVLMVAVADGPYLEWRFYAALGLLHTVTVSASRIVYRIVSDQLQRRTNSDMNPLSRQSSVFIGTLPDAAMVMRQIAMPESNLPAVRAVICNEYQPRGTFLGGARVFSGLSELPTALRDRKSVV